MISTRLLEHLAAILTMTFVAGLWQGMALALLAAALLRFMPRASARLRHGLLVAGFAAAVVLPWLRMNDHSPAAAATDRALPIASGIAAVVALVWLAAAAGSAVQLAAAWTHLRRVRRAAAPVVIEGHASFAAGRRRARLCASADVSSPSVLGFWQPALLLPAWMVPTLSAEELHTIALHECEHLRRGDDWLNLLLQVVLVLFPLNPALIWLNRRIGEQRELACDAAVVASTGEPIAYASCLTSLAEQRMQQRSHLRLALAAWERQSELAQRIHALLRQPALWSARQSGAAAAASLVVLLTVSAGFTRVPQFVRVAGNVAAPIATVLPPSALSPVILQKETGVRMLPASFTVKAKPRVVRSKPAVRPSRNAFRNTPFQSAPPAVRARAVQAAYVLRTHSTAAFPAWTETVQDQDVPVRLVPADLSTTPYVAVPLSSGWLLIEL